MRTRNTPNTDTFHAAAVFGIPKRLVVTTISNESKDKDHISIIMTCSDTNPQIFSKKR